MKKNLFFLRLFIGGLLFAGLVFASCGNPAQDGPGTTGGGSASLANVVYAGPDLEGNWATFAFYDEDTLYYFPDNVFCATGPYVYDADRAAGEIPQVFDAKPPNAPGIAPGAFAINDDDLTITFTDYAGQGSPQTFRRVRDADVIDDEVPFVFESLGPGDSLDGTVWAATAYRTNDWTTLTVTSTGAINEGSIDVSHSFDCTSFSRLYSNYAYNTQSTLSYIGDFRINGDNFTFINFYGHGGRITLKRMR
jgi:hypothetical protein